LILFLLLRTGSGKNSLMPESRKVEKNIVELVCAGENSIDVLEKL
jgi:hypothetical protein